MNLTRAEFEALFRAATRAEDEWEKEGGESAGWIAALRRAMRKVHAEGVPVGGRPVSRTLAEKHGETAEVTVRRLTREQMLAERAALLDESGLTEGELRARGEAWELDAHHRGILSRINGLDWLLSQSHTGPMTAPGLSR